LLEPQSIFRAAKAPALGHHRERAGVDPARKGPTMALQSLLETRSQEQNGVVTIVLSGDLDLATAPILSEKLAPFEGNGVSTIILDLQDLTFIDSTGMHTFVEARNRAMSNGQRLLVRGASPTAQRYIKIVGLQFLLDDPKHDLESPPG
jgi:anti-sigma B factor antagonist